MSHQPNPAARTSDSRSSSFLEAIEVPVSRNTLDRRWRNFRAGSFLTVHGVRDGGNLLRVVRM